MIPLRRSFTAGRMVCHPARRLMACCFLACLSAATAGCLKPPALSRPPESTLYQSPDYIVHQLESAESSARLAERFLGNPLKAWIIEEANPGVRFEGGQAVVVPLRRRNIGGLYADGFQTVPILTYHRFAEECQSPLCMPTAAFREQMHHLKTNGYHAITPEELLAFLEYRQPLPRRSVLITIDDGYRSTFDIAYPILRQLGFAATLFIYTELIDAAPIALTWSQILEMSRNGFTIGSHTIHHSDLTQPKEGESQSEYAARIEKELAGSKQALDRKLGQSTWVLAYPYGKYDQKVVASARQAGYTMGLSVKRGGNPFFADALTLRRDQVLERDMAMFVKRLKTFTPLKLE